MSDETKRKAPEREDTDRSLAAERTKTDAELAKRRAKVEGDADQVLSLARDRADALLAQARAQADRKLERSGASRAEHDAVETERANEDRVLASERAVAKERLQEERAKNAQMLDALLRLEREQTDAHLGIERDRADAVVVARDDFLGVVSHDLRTLLGGIALSAALILQERGDDPALGRVRVEAVRTQRFVARMDRLIGDLLDVVSIEAGQLHVSPANGDAAALAREIDEALRPLAEANGITMRTSASADSVPGWFDHERIAQVITNLVSNAIKFTEEGGRIDLAVRREGDHVEISVRDTGRGIPHERLPTIFERFARVGGDRTGLGLGLYISRCIVEAHGGRLSVESKVGEGSTFTFTLPAGSSS